MAAQAAAAIFRHSTPQRRQASAHCWQWSMSCLAHSKAQASQTSAHSRHAAGAWSLPPAMKAAAKWQICAQSVSSPMHRAMAFTSGSCRQQAAQWLQATAQAWQAAMHSWYSSYFSWDMSFLFIS
jgi:hypothetical protein